MFRAPCAGVDGGRAVRRPQEHHAPDLQFVARAGRAPGRGPAVCQRPRRGGCKLFRAAPGAWQARTGRGPEDPGGRLVKTGRQSVGPARPNGSKTELLREVHGPAKGAATLHNGWLEGAWRAGAGRVQTPPGASYENELASGPSTASNPLGAWPGRDWRGNAACGQTSSRSPSRNQKGAGITAMITSIHGC